MKRKQVYKVGKVALVGRPNAGKSTMLNNMVGQKVAIVSPKPQTTQSRITVIYEDERGQIFFRDTPGLFTSNLGKKNVRSMIQESIKDADAIAYVVDHSRFWGQEEEEIKKIVTESGKKFILVINKIDIEEPSHKDLYLEKLGDAPTAVLEVSALKFKGIKGVINTLFTLIPEGVRDEYTDDRVTPLLSQNSTQYLEELVREKVFLLTKQEVPYQAIPHITSVINNEDRNILKVKGHIEVTEEKYKAFLIGHQGKKIKEISDALRKELEITTGSKVYVTLRVTA